MTSNDKHRVLIVDDEILLANAIAFELEDGFGCETHCASSGNEALTLASTHCFSLVISDIHMPNGSGVHLLTSLKKSNPDIPVVILMTGESRYKEDEVRQLGAYALLAKPLDLTKLHSIVAACLGQVSLTP